MENQTNVKKDNRRTKYTKSVIKDSLLHFLNEKPLKNITITELCEYADINRGTFYKYYASVEELMRYVENEFLSGILQVAAKQLIEGQLFVQVDERAPLNQENFRKFFVGIINYLYTEKEMCVLIVENSNENIFLKRIIYVVSDYYISLWKKKVDLAERSDDIDFVRALAKYIACGIVNTVCDWISDGMETSPDEITDLIIRLLDTKAF